MKNYKIWYIVCFIGIFGLFLMFALKLSEAMKVVLAPVFAACLSISSVKIIHYKMLEKDHNYKVSINDERNEKIRDKVNGTMASVLMLLMGIISVICIALKAYLPALLLAISVGCSPLIMFFINRYFEQKY